MISGLRPINPAPLPCKICGGSAALFGVVDFNKCCVQGLGLLLPVLGVPIYYRRCSACGFLFTDAFDEWSCDQFKAYVYNADYKIVDPDYETSRPGNNSNNVNALFGAVKEHVRLLDYGGGNGALGNLLRANGFSFVATYDPMVPEYAQRPPDKFDVVTCFETLEHMTDPVKGIGQILEFLAEPGLVLFSTVVQSGDFETTGVNWWYVGPRNGHVSIFSRRALALAWRRYDYRTASFNENMHIAFKTLPPFATHLLK